MSFDPKSSRDLLFSLAVQAYTVPEIPYYCESLRRTLLQSCWRNQGGSGNVLRGLFEAETLTYENVISVARSRSRDAGRRVQWPPARGVLRTDMGIPLFNS
jgi:hypothetical protein